MYSQHNISINPIVVYVVYLELNRAVNHCNFTWNIKFVTTVCHWTLNIL